MKRVQISLSLIAVVTLSACTASTATSVSAPSCPECEAMPPGVVQHVWEEPMVDVVDVPPGLDPEGTYYRPAHREVVEIRQGRWKYYNPK